jgi:PilZ domain-containing protein
MLFARTIPLPLDVERRRFQRVRLDLQGRFMLTDGQESSCRVTNISPGGMALTASICPEPGERIVAYVDNLGRIEGVVVRQFPVGFAISITSTMHKRDKIAAQLTWLANRDILPDQRRHRRIKPKNPLARILLPNGFHVDCRVIDVSQSGAGIASDQRPEIGTLVTVGRTPGRVARHIEGGFAVEFTRLQHEDSLEENVTGG